MNCVSPDEVRATVTVASRRTELRLVVAFAALPPAAALLMFVTCWALLAFDVWIFEGSGNSEAAGALAAGAGLLAVFVTVFCAIPAVVWLIRSGSVSFSRVLLLGVIIANLPFIVTVILITLTHLARGTLASATAGLWFGWFGVARALLFGLWFGLWMAATLWVIGLRGSELDKSIVRAGLSAERRMG